MPALTNTFRIIGGLHRSRRLGFPPLPGIRPSPDRVRQTLFDWLAPVISGARCLDLYAGSGALGLEALSRGAASVAFVDREPKAIESIRAHLAALRLPPQPVIAGDALSALARLDGPYDVVFLDPPFDSGELGAALAALAERGLVVPGGRVYLEALAAAGPPALPAGFAMSRAKRAGNVGYHLAIRET
jgi:16S rRNA (guanine966-N2)-methyltransferase